VRAWEVCWAMLYLIGGPPRSGKTILALHEVDIVSGLKSHTAKNDWVVQNTRSEETFNAALIAAETWESLGQNDHRPWRRTRYLRRRSERSAPRTGRGPATSSGRVAGAAASPGSQGGRLVIPGGTGWESPAYSEQK
jgi:hypothetical protein